MDSDYRSVDLENGTIRYRDVGSGEPIVFVHGLLVNGRIWDDVVPLLEGYRCILPDLPLGAHEPAMAPRADLSPAGLRDVVVEFLDALGLERATLVGNDTGGAICQLVVAEYPKRVDRLVLTNCDAYDNFLPVVLRPLEYAAGVPGVVSAIGAALRFRPLQRAMLFVVAKRPIDTERMSALFEPIVRDRGVRRDVRKVLRGISPRYTLEAAETFGEFERPVLLVWAPEDPLFGAKYARRLAAAFPNATLKTVDDSRTFVQTDRPAALADAVRGFLEEGIAVRFESG
jgi:pimeloyl-ACP methyl ester carboxylesterase